jgi:hypothetical protein
MGQPNPDPTCLTCSKPIRSGSLVVYEHRELFHVACRSRVLQFTSIEQSDSAQTAKHRAVRLMDDARRAQTSRRSPPDTGDRRLTACPLCVHSATMTDWRPGAEWIAVEDCPCAGFFVWAPLLTERVRRLAARNRQDLAHRIRAFRAMGHEAWLTTLDGTLTGALVVRTARPSRPG